tara:strand:+ start:275 stop:502 length:228 start_codon:yes stop_codon:yes gene_type:complete
MLQTIVNKCDQAASKDSQNTQPDIFAPSPPNASFNHEMNNYSEQINFNDSQKACCPFESHTVPQISAYDYFFRIC